MIFSNVHFASAKGRFTPAKGQNAH